MLDVSSHRAISAAGHARTDTTNAALATCPVTDGQNQKSGHLLGGTTCTRCRIDPCLVGRTCACQCRGNFCWRILCVVW